MHTIEQRRAARAQECVAGIRGDVKAYKAVASSFPAMIRMNGLGQALAFIRSRKADEYGHVYGHVSGWLCRSPDGVLANGEDADALDELVKRDATTYRHAETEAMAFMVWIKRYAEAAQLRADQKAETPA